MELSSVELVLGSLVIALLVVVLIESQRISNLKDRVTRLERTVQPQVPVGTSGLPAAVEQQVRTLVDSRQKIMAIKLVRERTGLGLKEAKDLVDRF